MAELENILESLYFSASRPISMSEALKILNDPNYDLKAIKEAILRKATTPELREIGIKEGFQTMQDMGRRMIANGDLNFREFERVLSAS